MLAYPNERIGQTLSNSHTLIRMLAVTGIVVLTSNRVLERYAPGLLPTAGWTPASLSQKWFGITLDSLGLLALLGALFATLILLCVVFVNSKVNADKSECWIDCGFVAALYLTLVLS